MVERMVANKYIGCTCTRRNMYAILIYEHFLNLKLLGHNDQMWSLSLQLKFEPFPNKSIIFLVQSPPLYFYSSLGISAATTLKSYYIFHDHVLDALKWKKKWYTPCYIEPNNLIINYFFYFITHIHIIFNVILSRKRTAKEFKNIMTRYVAQRCEHTIWSQQVTLFIEHKSWYYLGKWILIEHRG